MDIFHRISNGKTIKNRQVSENVTISRHCCLQSTQHIFTKKSNTYTKLQSCQTLSYHFKYSINYFIPR